MLAETGAVGPIGWGDVLGVATLVISGLLALWIGTIKYTIVSKEQENNRRFGEVNADLATLRADSRNQNERLHTDEKKTIEQGGRIDRFEDKHERFEKDIADIKQRVERDMVTKSELHGLERMMREKLDEILRTQRPNYPSAGYQPRPTPGRYQGLGEGSTPSPPPPKKER